MNQAREARGTGAGGKEAGTHQGEPSVLSFKGATGGDERWLLLIRACMQTAVIAPGGQETVNMWCDGRGKTKGGSRKDVAKKIAADLNKCEPVFERSLSADTVVTQFQGALRMVQSLRHGTTLNVPTPKAQLLWELESADRRLAPKCSNEKRNKNTWSLRGWQTIHPDDVALQLTLMPKRMRAGNGNKKTKTKRRVKVRAVTVAVGNASPVELSSAWKTKCKCPGMWSKTSVR